MLIRGPFHCQYLRRSREEEGDPYILGRHRELLRRVMAADGITVPEEHIFEEIGSGERIETRPEFLRLLSIWENLPSGAGGVVGVVELSRLSRGLLSQQGRVQDALMRANIHVRTPHRTYDLRQFEDRFAFNAFGIVANAELELFKERCARGRAAMLRQGRIRTGRVPWGYIWDTGSRLPPRPHPDRFPKLQQICRQAVAVSVHALAARYAIPESTLLWTLTNPMICGWPAQRYRSNVDGRGYRGSGWRLPRDEWVWPEEPGDYPAACTRAEWEAIQGAIAGRVLQRGPIGSDEGWCRDVIRFAGAEGRVRLGAVRPPAGQSYLTYDLYRAGQPRLYISRDIVHEAAADHLQSALTRPELVTLAWGNYQRNRERQQREEAETPAKDAAAIRQLLARERERLSGLKEAEFDPSADEEDRSANLQAQQKTRKRIDQLKRDLQDAEHAAALPPELPAAMEALVLAALETEWSGIWETVPAASRRVLARSCLASVNVLVDPAARTRRTIHREVVGVEYQDWLAPYVE